jgi:hypothetical protein
MGEMRSSRSAALAGDVSVGSTLEHEILDREKRNCKA